MAAQFKNTTNHNISVSVNGSRKSIRPNEIISGPESLNAIPGLTMLITDVPAILNNKFAVPTKQQNQIFSFSTVQTSITVDPPRKTDLSIDIELELKYLQKMKNLNRNPSVTIAILTKNSFDLINNCCSSILEQVKYDNVTIMIVDTGTTSDQVWNYYSSLGEQCKNKNWNFKLIKLQSFFYGKNYNEAMKYVDTEYVLIQNNDTVALNDYVTEMMGTAVLRRVGSTGCRMVYPDKVTIQHDGQTLYNAPGGFFGGPSHLNIKLPVTSLPEPKTDLVDGNTAAGALMRVSEFIACNGFDERYKDIFQDVDLMMKIPPSLNKFNYCNKNAKIIHIDNASRLQKGYDPKRHADMIADSNFLRHQIVNNNWQKVKLPKQYDFSIITLVHNLDDYKDFLDSLKTQIGKFSVEIIGIPNFYNQFTSSYKALNTAADTANGNFLIYCHDDIVVKEDWLNSIATNIESLNRQAINWGVLGSAGITLEDKSAFFLIDEEGNELWKTDSSIQHDKPYYEVKSLDEMCLITDRNKNIRFSDNDLSGFHFYGINLCLVAKSRGMNNYAINSYIHHKSDGYKNISTTESFNMYKNQSEAFNTWAKSKGVKNWRSTTATSVEGSLIYFVKLPEK